MNATRVGNQYVKLITEERRYGKVVETYVSTDTVFLQNQGKLGS
jgi:hypothetical protein